MIQDIYECWVESGEDKANLLMIQSLSMQGINLEGIAEEIGISARTLKRLQAEHIEVRKAIKSGRKTVVAVCQQALMENVQNGDTGAIIYALKIYGGKFFNDRLSEAEREGKPAAGAEFLQALVDIARQVSKAAELAPPVDKENADKP